MYVEQAPSLAQLAASLDHTRFMAAINAPEDPRTLKRYLHWDKLRHLKPPTGLAHDEWWLAIKFARSRNARRLPLTDAAGSPFTFTLPDLVLRSLHHIDQRCSGEIAMPEVVTADTEARTHYLVNSLMEEAIRSSQLEGATTSRRVAKDLLRSGRVPRDRSERMILNNYRGLRFMREEIGDRLTPESVLELHRVLTEGTLDDPEDEGRLQSPGDDRVAVHDRHDGSLLHTPPPAEQLPRRLNALCRFANDREGEPFLHPVVRAVILHFWLGYDHPFADGNGRTARALFLWSMRTQGYWLVEYLSVSRILVDAPGQYGRAYLLTERDERDATYFLLYHLEVIERAVEELHGYLERKVSEVREVERLIRGAPMLNHRQLDLVSHALRGSEREYTFIGHANSHAVTHETARTDLSQLVELGLLERSRAGRSYVFRPREDLTERLKGLRELTPSRSAEG